MTKVRRGFLDSLLILGHSISRPLHSRLWQFFWFMVSAHAYPTFELSYAVPLLAKTAARERNCCSHVRNPLLSGNPLPYLTGEVPDHVPHDVVLVLDLPLHFWLMLYYFPFLWLYYCSFLYIVIAGGVTPIDSIVTAATTRSNLGQLFLVFWLLTTPVFGALTIDCIEFQPLIVDLCIHLRKYTEECVVAPPLP